MEVKRPQEARCGIPIATQTGVPYAHAGTLLALIWDNLTSDRHVLFLPGKVEDDFDFLVSLQGRFLY